MTQEAAKPPQDASPPAQTLQEPGAERELEAAINQRLARLLGSDLRLSIERDEGSGDFVYKSVDKTTGEVKRQYPAESILRMLAFFRELEGLIYDKKA